MAKDAKRTKKVIGHELFPKNTCFLFVLFFCSFAALQTTLLERTRTVVDQLAVPSVVIDQKGIIHAFNEAASQLFGYEATEVISRNVSCCSLFFFSLMNGPLSDLCFQQQKRSKCS